CVSRWISSSRRDRHQPVSPRKPLLQFQLLWGRMPILLATVSSPALRPGGNITGLSTLAPEISGKQLEFLKEIVPRLSRVAVFGNSKEPANPQSLKEAELAAGAFRIKLQYVDVPSPKEIEPAFRAANKGRAGAVLVFGAFIFNPHRAQIADLAARN